MSALPIPLRARMKPLPLRLRLAHLRALLRREPSGTKRAQVLTALLREQLAAHAKAERAI
ncbi:MAG TPA: hypothetical protein VI216_05090 [Candidatus Acidoferrales bacterium]